MCSSGQSSCGLSVQQELPAGPTSAQQKVLVPLRSYTRTVWGLLPQYTWCCGCRPRSFISSYSSTSLQRTQFEFNYVLLSCSEMTAVLFTQVYPRKRQKAWQTWIPQWKHLLILLKGTGNRALSNPTKPLLHKCMGCSTEELDVWAPEAKNHLYFKSYQYEQV